jgi:hypothetical protein
MTEVKLITAQEARELVQSSDELVSKMLNCISTEISIACKLGARFIYLDKAIGSPIFHVNNESFRANEPTPIQQLYFEKLQAAGYQVKMDQQTYKGGGLGCMEENPPDVTRWHIKVSW